MANIVEDGTGKVDANAYASVADANAYFASYGEPTGWRVQDVEREEAMRQATEYLDKRYAGRWEGTKVTSTQALSWPRGGVFDDSNYALAQNVIPEKLKRATYKVAIRYLNLKALGEDLMPDIDEPGGIQSESLNIGGAISESITYAGSKSMTRRFPEVDALVADFIGPLSSVRLRRG
jgi:hypothetical protein